MRILETPLKTENENDIQNQYRSLTCGTRPCLSRISKAIHLTWEVDLITGMQKVYDKHKWHHHRACKLCSPILSQIKNKLNQNTSLIKTIITLFKTPSLWHSWAILQQPIRALLPPATTPTTARQWIQASDWSKLHEHSAGGPSLYSFTSTQIKQHHQNKASLVLFSCSNIASYKQWAVFCYLVEWDSCVKARGK